MTSFQISTVLNIGSILLGVCAWILAAIAIITPREKSSHRNTVFSFCCCAAALVFQLFEVGNRVNVGDFAAIEDTIRAVLLAAVVLVITTAALNIAALVRCRR